MRYLLVDDDEHVRRILSSNLSRRGHQVVTVPSGAEALDCLRIPGPLNFDLALLDYSMPGLDGMQTFERLKVLAPDLPVVMVTAYDSTALAVAFMRAGGDMFVAKPIDFDLLEVVSRDVVEKACLRASAREAHAAALVRDAEVSAILDSSPGAIMVFDADGAVRQLNPAADRLFAMAGDRPAPNVEHLVPGLRARADALTSGKIGPNHGTGAPVEMTGVCANRVFPVDVGVALLRSGPEALFIATCQDITERVKAREALRGSEARLRALLKNASAAISLKDVEGRFLLVNPAWERMFGHTAAAAIGHTAHEVFPAHFADASVAKDLAAFTLGPISTETILPPLGNAPGCTALSFKFPVLDENGHVIGTGGILTDITERKESEQRLADSEAKLRAIVEGEALIGMSILDLTDGPPKIRYASPRLAEIVGCSAGQLQEGGTFLDLVVADDRARLEADIRRALAGLPQLGTYRVRHRDGCECRIEARHSRARYGGGDVVVGVLRSMTVEEEAAARAKRAEDARLVAEDASHAKSAFLAGISHELRTPLTAILGFAEVAERRLAEGDVKWASQHIKRIVANAERLAEVIDTVLDLSKIESRREAVHFAPHVLANLVAEAAADLEALSDARRLTIRLVNRLPQGRKIICDRQHISRLVVNLLSNAIKFAFTGSTITVVIQDAGETVQLTVQDFGMPIPEHDLLRVFEPFAQSSLTDDGSGGTGLGLALCRQIVRLHGGNIEARSNEHEGVVFTVNLPWSAVGQNAVPLESVA